MTTEAIDRRARAAVSQPPGSLAQALARGGRVLMLVLLATLTWLPAQAQELDIKLPTTTADPALTQVMRDLALRLLPVYQDTDSARYLDNLSVLQMATGNWPSAQDQRQSLRERRGASSGRDAVFDLYSRARMLEHEEAMPFAQAWTRVFRQSVPRLLDPEALEFGRLLKTPAYQYRNELQQLLDRHRDQGRISIEAGLRLVRAWLTFDTWRVISPLVGALVIQDQSGRYQQDDVPIQLPGQRPLVAHLILPKAAPKHLPAQLIFRAPGPDVDEDDDLALAARGSAVVILPLAAPPPLPPGPRHRSALRRRAAYFTALAHWVGHQPWSNGHVEFPREAAPAAGANAAAAPGKQPRP